MESPRLNQAFQIPDPKYQQVPAGVNQTLFEFSPFKVLQRSATTNLRAYIEELCKKLQGVAFKSIPWPYGTR